MRNIEVVDYRKAWDDEFQREARSLQDTIGFLSPAIHHIGSTSVPGLAAKPVIDIMLEIDDLELLEQQAPALAAIGYKFRGENGIPGRLYFEKGGEDRSHQIHAFERGSFGALRHLAFRDYLRSHPDIAHKYAALKKHVASVCNNDIELYCDGKDAFIQEHERRAVAWYSDGQREPSDHRKAASVEGDARRKANKNKWILRPIQLMPPSLIHRLMIFSEGLRAVTTFFATCLVVGYTASGKEKLPG